jgi:hypothetical protein
LQIRSKIWTASRVSVRRCISPHFHPFQWQWEKESPPRCIWQLNSVQFKQMRINKERKGD